ncbi:helix-turn-helix transcriptional regulator [Streptomyces sp. NPDC051578]|uniref:helix-turn-helix transcriptional regulator n=1 Tax=Streptomyces sp. NPDC051578 TaxID=3365662 RepID=UPI0037A2EA42
MNPTARLYALVEELRSAAPPPVTVAALATRFEVSTRTVQRNLQTLMEAGKPVRSIPGRGGGWSIAPEMTLPPVHLTADEASAVTAALAAAGATTPYAGGPLRSPEDHGLGHRPRLRRGPAPRRADRLAADADRQLCPRRGRAGPH